MGDALRDVCVCAYVRMCVRRKPGDAPTFHRPSLIDSPGVLQGLANVMVFGLVGVNLDVGLALPSQLLHHAPEDMYIHIVDVRTCIHPYMHTYAG